MLFYKIEAVLTEPPEKREDKRRRRGTEYAADFCSISDIMYTDSDRKAFLFVSQISRVYVTVGAALKKGVLTDKTIEEFFSRCKMKAKDCKISEITGSQLKCMLHWASMGDFVSDDDNVLELLGVDGLLSRFRNSSPFDEELIEEKFSFSEALDAARLSFCSPTLVPEIERIFDGCQSTGFVGHPVQYLIEADDEETKNSVLSLLTSSLFAVGRLTGKRRTQINIRESAFRSKQLLSDLYDMSESTAVVIDLSSDDDDDEYAQPINEIVKRAACEMKKHRRNVLTFVCVPSGSNSLKQKLYEYLGNTAVVEIRQQPAEYEKAKEYLKTCAKNNGVRANKKLYSVLDDEGKTYTARELNTALDIWLTEHLKTKVYPQYKSIECVNKSVLLQRPKGSAYDELCNMIGLTQAKEMISQAIDYYKAQKVFAERRMAAGRASMHMVFTGSPGTAKTTVARLFAQIMADNGILSSGEFHEVGRSDLVGKYVGWTAQIVKEKFKQAKGGVLFIDEAYSLVDGKAGLFGDEAINTIVQEMENMREDIIVIFAGYTDKMEEFIARNPGLRSRIAFNINFDDYSAEELFEITELLSKNNGLILGNGVREKLIPVFESVSGTTDFGNGRYARNIVEKARMKQAARLVRSDIDKLSDKDIATLLPQDFEITEPKKEEKVIRLGFSA